MFKTILTCLAICFSLNSYSQALTQNDHYRVEDYFHIETVKIKTDNEIYPLSAIFNYKINGLTITMRPFYLSYTDKELEDLVAQASKSLSPDKVEYSTFKYANGKEYKGIVFTYNQKPKWMKGDHTIK